MGTHASLLSDTPDRSVLASAYDWGARSGYTWSSWAVLTHIEQKIWLRTEFNDRSTSCVLNFVVGGAYTYGEKFVRTSIVFRTSILLFDQSGTTRIFTDLRPIELC